MTRRDAISTDLVMEILSRLPAKSIARCLCVSKQWGSMLLSPYFTELFLTKLSPRLLFAGKRFDDWCFFTSPQLQNLDEKPSSLTADFHMKFPQEFCGSRTMLVFCGHASGFILFRRVCFLGRDDDTMPLLGVCNPSTGQYASLPRPKSADRVGWYSFLGFDPIDKQFKVLFITKKEEPNQILTLGTGNDSWREIHCPLNHSSNLFSQGICINGVLYYLATQKSLLPSLIVCFDVRSEKFKFIYGEDYKGCDKLVNYKGELGMISFEYGPSSRYPDRYCFDKLRMWVIKDVEDLEWEWLECFSFCWADELYVDECYFSIIGVTATGEIVLSNKHASEPFYVIYINQEKNTIQKVEIKIQGLRADDYQVEVFADYVENLNFITMLKTRKCNSVTTSTSSKAPHPQQNGRITFESTNKFDSLRLLDDDECT